MGHTDALLSPVLTKNVFAGEFRGVSRKKIAFLFFYFPIQRLITLNNFTVADTVAIINQVEVSGCYHRCSSRDEKIHTFKQQDNLQTDHFLDFFDSKSHFPIIVI